MQHIPQGVHCGLIPGSAISAYQAVPEGGLLYYNNLSGLGVRSGSRMIILDDNGIFERSLSGCGNIQYVGQVPPDMMIELKRSVGMKPSSEIFSLILPHVMCDCIYSASAKGSGRADGFIHIDRISRLPDFYSIDNYGNITLVSKNNNEDKTMGCISPMFRILEAFPIPPSEVDNVCVQENKVEMLVSREYIQNHALKLLLGPEDDIGIRPGDLLYNSNMCYPNNSDGLAKPTKQSIIDQMKVGRPKQDPLFNELDGIVKISENPAANMPAQSFFVYEGSASGYCRIRHLSRSSRSHADVGANPGSFYTIPGAISLEDLKLSKIVIRNIPKELTTPLPDECDASQLYLPEKNLPLEQRVPHLLDRMSKIKKI